MTDGTNRWDWQMALIGTVGTVYCVFLTHKLKTAAQVTLPPHTRSLCDEGEPAMRDNLISYLSNVCSLYIEVNLTYNKCSRKNYSLSADTDWNDLIKE